MPLTKIISISGKAVPVVGADMDTDRIIPARFLKCITFDELAGTMFYDERFHTDGSSKNHPIDAPQAIKRSGVQAIVAETFAEIFFGNSSGIGLPCVRASREDIARAIDITTTAPDTQWTVNLEDMTLSCATASFPITMPSEPREALMQGKWDAVVELMNAPEAVAALAASLPAPSSK